MEAVLKTSRKQISKNIRSIAGYSQDVLVYGCGRYVDHAKEKLGDKVKGWSFYDPYVEGFNVCPSGQFDQVILDNVINVIQDNSRVLDVVILAVSKCKQGGWVSIGIYEGNRSGVHTFEGGKCQRNETIGAYAPMFKLVLGVEVHKINGGIALRKLG